MRKARKQHVGRGPAEAAMTADEFRRIRVDVLSLTQFQLALALKVTPPTISLYERGSTPVDQARADQLRVLVARAGGVLRS